MVLAVIKPLTVYVVYSMTGDNFREVEANNHSRVQIVNLTPFFFLYGFSVVHIIFSACSVRRQKL